MEWEFTYEKVVEMMTGDSRGAALRARVLVEREFTYGKAVERFWRRYAMTGDRNDETRLVCSSPECIAANVIRDLEYQDIEGVAHRARALVEREFTYEKAVEGYRSILACLRRLSHN